MTYNPSKTQTVAVDGDIYCGSGQFGLTGFYTIVGASTQLWSVLPIKPHNYVLSNSIVSASVLLPAIANDTPGSAQIGHNLRIVNNGPEAINLRDDGGVLISVLGPAVVYEAIAGAASWINTYVGTASPTLQQVYDNAPLAPQLSSPLTINARLDISGDHSLVPGASGSARLLSAPVTLDNRLMVGNSASSIGLLGAAEPAANGVIAAGNVTSAANSLVLSDSAATIANTVPNRAILGYDNGLLLIGANRVMPGSFNTGSNKWTRLYKFTGTGTQTLFTATNQTSYSIMLQVLGTTSTGTKYSARIHSAAQANPNLALVNTIVEEITDIAGASATLGTSSATLQITLTPAATWIISLDTIEFTYL